MILAQIGFLAGLILYVLLIISFLIFESTRGIVNDDEVSYLSSIHEAYGAPSPESLGSFSRLILTRHMKYHMKTHVVLPWHIVKSGAMAAPEKWDLTGAMPIYQGEEISMEVKDLSQT